MDNYIENYTHHRDVLVHKIRIRFHISVFLLPVFLVLIVQLLFLASSRSIFPSSQNSYVVENPLYISPLASPPPGEPQVGIGGGPPHLSTPSASPTK